MKHLRSKFVWDAFLMKLVKGKLPFKHQQLFKGEDANGKKMEIVWNDRIKGHTCYWGWS